MSGAKKKCLIIGIGNRFRSDDAVGIVVAEELQKRKLPRSVEVINAGADELGLIDHFERGENVILIDALSTGKPPGTIRVFSADEAKTVVNAPNLALHTIGLAGVIELARKLKLCPRITIFGIEPQSTAPGETLSWTVSSRIPELVETVMKSVNALCSRKGRTAK